MSAGDSIVLYRSSTLGHTLDATLATMANAPNGDSMKISHEQCLECLNFFDQVLFDLAAVAHRDVRQ